MANDVIKLAGEHQEHSDNNIEVASDSLPDSSSDCVLNHFGKRALEEYGVSEDMAPLFTTSESLQALNYKVPPELALKFENGHQTSALVLLGAKHAELALSFTSEIQSKALVKALDLGIDHKIALDVTERSSKDFQSLAKDSTVTQALKLGVPLEKAFKFDKKYKVQAWEKIKSGTQTDKEKSEGVTDAILIDSHTKLEALKEGVPAKKAQQFIHATQVDAWKEITSNDQLSLTPDQAAIQALQINTSTKLVALQAGVDPETASDFVNQFQTDAWSKKIKSLKGYTAEAALKIDTDLKLQALLAGVTPGLAIKFTDQHQIEAWGLISAQLNIQDAKLMEQSVAFAIATTKDVQLEALKAGVPPSNAAAFVNDYQIEIWNAKKDSMDLVEILKLVGEAASFKSKYQANVLLAGADANTAKLAVSSTHEEAYIKYGVTSPNLLKKFDAQHKLDLLAAGVDQETASKASWFSAQYLLINSDPKKYREEMLIHLKSHINSFRENPRDYLTWEAGALVTSAVVSTVLLGFTVYKFIKAAASLCFKGPAAPTRKISDGVGGLDF